MTFTVAQRSLRPTPHLLCNVISMERCCSATYAMQNHAWNNRSYHGLLDDQGRCWHDLLNESCMLRGEVSYGMLFQKYDPHVWHQ